MTIDQYLCGEETNRPQELRYGVLHEPPSPGVDHQTIVGRLHLMLSMHVRKRNLGRVLLSPMDVVLDSVRALVVQPDLLFISTARLSICSERVHGAPDLVIEVLSPFNRRHDRHTKVGWYRQYGVRECWVIDPIAKTVEVFDFSQPGTESRLFDGGDRIVSGVFPALQLSAQAAFFD
jgi:Uma2 family endonuclease